MIDLDTAEGAVSADVLPQAVERSLLDRLHVTAVFLKDLVVAGIAHVVVLLDLSDKTFHIDAGLLGKFFDGVSLGHRLIAVGKVTVPLLIKVVIQIVRMYMGDNVRAMLLVLFQQLTVENGVADGAGLYSDGIACEGGSPTGRADGTRRRG